MLAQIWSSWGIIGKSVILNCTSGRTKMASLSDGQVLMIYFDTYVS